MDPETFDRETAANQKAYEALRDQIRREYAGQYVGLALGRVVAAAPTYDATVALVEQMKPVPEYFLVFPADEEPCFEPYYSY